MMGRKMARSMVTLARTSDYPHIVPLATRWNDNDSFGHVNNAVYYTYMDDAVNSHLIQNGIGLAVPRFVIESSCRYQRPLAYPMGVDVGLAVERIGRTSVQYRLGIFGRTAAPTAGDGDCLDSHRADGKPFLAATGKFVHVYVDPRNGRPLPVRIPDEVREVLRHLERSTTRTTLDADKQFCPESPWHHH